MTEKTILKNYCNVCDKNTNHSLLESHEWHSDPDDYSHAQLILDKIMKGILIPISMA